MKPASLGSRFLAAIVNALLVLFIALPFARFDARLAVWTVEIAIVLLYRRLFGATPGQQLVGLRRHPIVPGLAVATISELSQWLRGLAAILAIVYLGLTWSAAVLIAGLTNAKLDAARVRMMPNDVPAPVSVVSGEREEFERLSIVLPRTLGGFSVENVNCCALYGGGGRTDTVQPGIFVAAMNDLHPYEYCRGVVNPTAGWLAGCGATPLAFQHRIAETTPGSRFWTVSPLDVVRINFALVAKNIYFEELRNSSDLRRFRSGDAEVLWLRGKRVIKTPGESVEVDLDRFLIANASSYGAVDIVWKKVPREEGVAELVAASIRLRKPDQADIRRELDAAKSGNALLHLTNAFRMSGYSPETATLLRDRLAQEGTARQKRYFALVLKGDAERTQRLRDLATAVAGWL